MRVHAVVVAYNSSKDLPESLGSLRALPLERIIVADNSSKDHSADLARQYTPYVLTRANDGFGAAINDAVAASPGAEAYLFFNPDARIDPGDYARLVEALRADPKLGAVAPMMRYPDGSFGVSSGSEPSMAKEWLAALRVDDMVPAGLKRRMAASPLMRKLVPMLAYLDREPTPETRPVDWVSGFCMLVRAEAFHSIGGFDKSFFLYFEDVDICVRLRRYGWGVSVVGSAVAHHKESTSTAAVGKNRLYRDGMTVYFDRHGGRGARVLAKALRRFPI